MGRKQGQGPSGGGETSENRLISKQASFQRYPVSSSLSENPITSMHFHFLIYKMRKWTR